MSRVYWDSMLFIYLIEKNPNFVPRVKQLMDRMEKQSDHLITSAFSIGEILTGPRKSGALDVVARVQNWFDEAPIEILPFDRKTADRYSQIRATTRTRPADAIHLATASIAGADVFVTNDKQLSNIVVPGIHFIVGLDGVLF